MAFTKFILPLLAVAGAVLAQCPDTDTTGAFTIQSQGDAATFENCQTFKGSVIIASSVAGNIQLNGVQQITGNLSCVNNTGLTSLSSDQLSSIGQYFHLEDITVLSNLQMDSLTEVNTVNFVGLPNLQGLNFNTGVQKADGIRIVNTQMASLAGIELSTVAAMEVTNNDFLTDINVNNLKSISDEIILAANGADLSIEFPNLLTAANMTFRDISAISVPSLANVTGSLGFYQNSISGFSAANLTLIGNALVFDNNTSLTNVSLPMLTTVDGGFQIANNTKLHILDGFTKLQTVGGALDFSGGITNVSLPALKDVKGGFNMQSTDELDCTPFNTDHSNKIIKGTYVCSGSLSKAGTKGSTPTSTSSGSSSSSTGHSGAGAVVVNSFSMGLVGAVAALFMI